ncbi:unnamed protein product [Linum tenue]|uniref:Uncharacterized protein n=1 Tax=Linum tenue TaxID=586396 RepID=A0AAV0MLM5_9ROSI|nr:unnamed protein product [Linum tenue]
MEDVVFALRLVDLRLPGPPVLPQRLAVKPPSVLQRVLLRHQNQHPPATQTRQLRVGGSVYLRVIQPVLRTRIRQPPQPGRQGPARFILGLIPDRVFPPKIRVHKHKAQQLNQFLLRVPHGDAVGDVGAGAVPGHKHPLEIDARVQPLLRAGSPGRGPAIVVGARERVLGDQPVVDGDGDDLGFGDQGVEVGVVDRGERALDAEPAAVDVD